MSSSQHHRHTEFANQKTIDIIQPAKYKNLADGIDWRFRSCFIAIGALGIAAGLNSFLSGQNWFIRHSPRFGWISTPTLYLAALGFVFVILGILPWAWIARRLERRRRPLVDRLMSTSSRHLPPESDR